MKRESQSHPIQLFRDLVLAICKYPESCSFDQHDGSLTIRPHMADYRVLVGAHGRMVNALKFLGHKAGFEVNLIETFRGEAEAPDGFMPDPNFDVSGLIETARDLSHAVLDCEVTITVEHPDAEHLSLCIEPVRRTQEDSTIVSAIGTVFYMLGIRQGRKIKVRCASPALK